MRGTRTVSVVTVAVAGSVLLAACGSGSKKPAQLAPLAAVQQASDVTSKAGSEDVTATEVVQESGQTLHETVSGPVTTDGTQADMTVAIDSGSGGTQTIKERVVGGKLYLQIPGKDGWYVVSVADLVGTSLAGSTSPTSGLEALKQAGDVKRVGPDTKGGVAVTHYSGTLDGRKTLSKLGGASGSAAAQVLAANPTLTVPFDAYIDAQGRVREFVDNLSFTLQGQTVKTTTTLDLTDFGKPITVTAPPAAQVHDGSALLQALKGSGTGS